MICIPAPKWALQFAKTKNFGSISFTTVIIKDGRSAIGHMLFWEQALKKSDTQFSLEHKYTTPISNLLRSSFITISFLLWIPLNYIPYSNVKVSFFSLKTFSKALESTLESPQKELGLTPNGASDREREEQTWPPYTIGLKKPEKKCNLGKS